MSSSGTDDESTNELDDFEDGMYDDDDYDDIQDFDDVDHLSTLFDSLVSTGTSDVAAGYRTDHSSSHTIRSAFGISSSLSSHGKGSSSTFGDSIRSYVEASTLFGSTINSSPYYLSVDPTINQLNSNPVASDKLFVGNIIYQATSQEVKDFFNQLQFNVIHINLPKNKKGIGNAGHAFVRFASANIAENLLYHHGRTPQKFVFKGRQLRIDRCKKSQQAIKATALGRSINDDTSSVLTFPIANVHYGTFIVGTAMKNITSANDLDDFGFIAHRLINNGRNMAMRLRIDERERKFSIVISCSHEYSSSELAFEWAFSTLKGEKISPVLINDSNVGMLVQVKRPPIIVHTVSHDLIDADSAIRMPGTPLIGRANAWLFQLNGSRVTHDYMRLFRSLRCYNLTPKRFSEYHILRLIHPLQVARESLRHVRILSNDEWVRNNRQIVDRFLTYRWPQYPFETKFELMKLLSKHILTVNDLIMDEELDRILAQCSLNTLIACTDKIIEFAPRWLHDTCDNEDEDWDEEDPLQITEQESVEEAPNSIDHSSPVTVCSAMGSLIDATNTDLAFSSDNRIRFQSQVQRSRLGCLSRFLILALKQLQQKNALRRIRTNGVFVTRHELHPINPNVSLIRKVYITPATVLYEGPYQEEKCSVTRHFASEQDSFLRVTFCDEDFRKLQYNGIDLSKLYDRIKLILVDGIRICDRHYDFLAFSSSQLREHCCWMFTSVNNISVNDIYQWMGDFRNIHPVAKMAARLGQSFSTTKKGLELQRQQLKQISDVKLGKTCFTDGVGVIAPWLVDEVCKRLHIDTDIYRPCAFQIRLGGYKGMVCLDVASRIRGPDVGLYLRPSMNKFDSKNCSIDIVRVSSIPSVGFLNRQIILLLSSLGIRDEAFFSMQEEMLQHLRTLTIDADKARQFLRQFGGSGGNGYHVFLLAYLKSFGNKIDPFARQILVVFQAFLVKELRTKARLLLPNTWSLLGVADETGILHYGQVFIRIEEKNDDGDLVSKVLTGSVIVTRNPCFHPGDIRRLEAIDIPALHRLKNVIVFPINGCRSHPAEMSGGDLDGDTFWISQEQQLIFKQHEEPFDYHDQATEDAKLTSTDINTIYTRDDICNFFVQYIEADNLGAIANSHLAFADQSPLRAKAPECLRLARMHSTAVDFAKTGIPAPRLTSDLRPAQYPHFMENKFKSSYHSTTILGQLYDEVKEFEANLNDDKYQNPMYKCSFPYETLVVEGSEAHINAAEITKNEYDLELKRVMRQYGIKSEAELVTGYILKFTTKQYAKQAKTFDLRNEISHAVKAIQEKYLRIFYEEVYYHVIDEKESNSIVSWSDAAKKLTWKNQADWFTFHSKMEIANDSEVAKKASAWFRVTYKWMNNQMKQGKKKKRRNRKRKNQPATNQQRNESLNNKHRFQPLLSFAWIVYPILMKIYDEKQETVHTH